MDYLTIKSIHVGSVAASYVLFVLRGVWMLRGSAVLRERWVRVVPHAVDTVLLVSAVTIAVMSRQYPFDAPWLTAKVLALFAYVGLGSAALTRGPTTSIRLTAWLAAQCVFLYIVAVALTRDPTAGLLR